MNITINIRDTIAKAHQGGRILVPASTDLSELLEFNDIDEDQTLDIDALLGEKRILAHYWSIEDVRQTCPDLTDDQAWKVLQQLDDKLRISYDLAGDLFADQAAKLYVLRSQRTSRCDQALRAYAEGDEAENLIDLLADAQHWCRERGQDFRILLETAKRHFDDEQADR